MELKILKLVSFIVQHNNWKDKINKNFSVKVNFEIKTFIKYRQSVLKKKKKTNTLV